MLRSKILEVFRFHQKSNLDYVDHIMEFERTEIKEL